MVGDTRADLRVAVLDAADRHADLVLLDAVQGHRQVFACHAARLEDGRRYLEWIAGIGVAVIHLAAGLAMLGLLWSGSRAVEQHALSGPLLVGLLLACLCSFQALAVIVRNVAKLGPEAAVADQLLALLAKPVVVEDGTIVPRHFPGG